MKRPIIIAIALYFVLAIGILFVWPKYKDLNLVKKTIETQETEIKNNNDYFDNLKAIDDNLAASPEELSKIDSALPPESSPTDLFNFFQSISSNNGLILKEVSLAGSSRLSGSLSKIEEKDFTIVVVGTYPAFKNFLSEIEKSARLIGIENISFSSASLAGTKTGAISFTVAVKTYDYPE